MSTASGQSIDQALEQVAEYFAEGKLDSVEALLPEIIANGDEIQQQMGVIYREQLELLRAEEASPTEAEEYIFAEDEGTQETSTSDWLQAVEDEIDTHATPFTQSAKTHADNLAGQEESSRIFSHTGDQADTSDHPPSSTQSIDLKLDKIAELLADGRFDKVEAILPTILANGNDTQKQIAQAYYEQLSMLRSSNTENKLEPVVDHQEATPANFFQQEITAHSRPAQNAPEQPNQLSAENEEKQSHDDEQIVPAEENDHLQQKKRSLGEAVLERALSLIGVDDTKAIKLLNRIVEAGSPTQQQEALKHLDQLGRLKNGTQVDISEPTIESGEDGRRLSPTSNILNETPPSKITTHTDSAAVDIPPKSNLSTDKRTTNLDDLNDIGQHEKQIAHANKKTPSIEESNPESVTRTDPHEHENNPILRETTDGLRHPKEVLQAAYHSDALPTWDVDISILQHEKAENYRQGFFVGDTALMIDFADGSELMDVPETYSVPNAPPWLIGVTSVHSFIIPVFDLARFFDLPNSKKQKKMLLILGHGDGSIGIIISGIPTRIQWQDSQSIDQNTAPMALRKCIHDAYLLNNQLWFDLDSTALMTELKSAMRAH